MNLLKTIRRYPKRFGVIAAAFAVVATGSFMSMAAGTWGPERQTFTVEKPAPYVTFNSITNNPVDGDERNFVRAKPVDGSAALSDTVGVQANKEYVVRMVVHNNAGDNLDLESINTRVKAAVPNTTGKSVDVTGFVTADNAKPAEVWDSVRFTSDENFNLAYVAGSAKIYNQGYAKDGASLADSIVTSTGAKIGYEKAEDGKIPGCFEYLSYVEFKVKPQFAKQADFTMSKTVRMKGDTTWSESVDAKSGDTVQYRILYRNSGEVQQDDVTMRDKLPAGMSYVNGTTNLYFGSDPNTAHKLSDNITGQGVNIGSYAPGAVALVIFDAKVKANDDLPECGLNTLTNVAYVDTDHGTKDDDAKVDVTKKCDAPKPIAECVELKITSLTDRSYRLDAKASVSGGATIKAYSFAIKNVPPADPDLPSIDPIYFYETVTTSEATASVTTGQLTALKPGQSYLAYVSVNTSEGYRTGENCEVTFKVPEQPEPPKKIEVCDLDTKTITEVTKEELEANPERYTTDLDKCDEVEEPKTEDVCELKTGEVITINEGEFDSELHSRDLSECDEEVTPTPEEPREEEDGPKVIAATGPGQIIGGLFGSSALGLGLTSYLRSRRALGGLL